MTKLIWPLAPAGKLTGWGVCADAPPPRAPDMRTPHSARADEVFFRRHLEEATPHLLCHAAKWIVMMRAAPVRQGRRRPWPWSKALFLRAARYPRCGRRERWRRRPIARGAPLPVQARAKTEG